MHCLTDPEMLLRIAKKSHLKKLTIAAALVIEQWVGQVEALHRHADADADVDADADTDPNALGSQITISL